MPKTTTTEGTDRNAIRTTTADDYEAEVDEIVAAWDRAELEKKRNRARDIVDRRRFDQERLTRVADVAFWERRFARHGCRPVLAAWPSCPVPRTATSPWAPTARGQGLEAPRPVVYDAATYKLDEQGIWLRRAGYWISSPCFQIARGVDDTNPHLYAVEVNGKWRTAEVDPRLTVHDSGALPNALNAAGLRLNPQPVHLNGNLDAVAASRNQDHYTFEAWERLNVFLADHARELPLRS